MDRVRHCGWNGGLERRRAETGQSAGNGQEDEERKRKKDSGSRNAGGGQEKVRQMLARAETRR